MNGSVKIEFQQIPYNHVLLTFANDQSNKNATIDEIDCWSTVNDSMIVSNLAENETQTFCLMEKEAKTVSPLDCLSILPRNMALDSDEDSVWLWEDDKALTIGLLVAGLIICLVFGFGIGIVIVKRQAKAQNCGKETSFSRPDLISSDWKHDNPNEDIGYPYCDNDTISISSERSDYVAAVNPSRFDLIKMRLEKAENPAPSKSENLYDLEDMPSSKVYMVVVQGFSIDFTFAMFSTMIQAPTAPEGFRDSGISTCGPIYAISSKVTDRNDQSDNNGENLYLCVDAGNMKKNE